MSSEILRTIPYEDSQPAPESEGAQLLALEGPLRARVFPLDRECIQLGRAPDNDLVLASGAVSSKHAQIRREADLYFVEDLGSMNGVAVNGSRLEPATPRRLDHGDNLRIADHLFLFRQEKPLVDASGACSIRLDQEKIEAEVAQLLKDWRLATANGS
jgi:pSer/pThr/pTyr-binding forkhead associated (FHA) protein